MNRNYKENVSFISLPKKTVKIHFSFGFWYLNFRASLVTQIKNPHANTGNEGSITGLGRFPEQGGNGNPL